MKERQVSQAHIIDNWVICPFCLKKQFPVEAGTNIVNLKYRCRSSRADSEHFMMINYESEDK